MENDEEIRAHVVSIWRESKKFLSIGGREGMLVLTDKHLSFIHKTTAKIKWWKAITQRQALIFMKSKDTMIHHDGYDEKDLVIDQKNPKNTVLSFNDILNLEFEEKEWGSVLTVEYAKLKRIKNSTIPIYFHKLCRFLYRVFYPILCYRILMFFFFSVF